MQPSGAVSEALPTQRRRTRKRMIERSTDSTFIIRRRNRFWEVVDPAGDLVCITVYKRGAMEVVRRLDVARAASMG